MPTATFNCRNLVKIGINKTSVCIETKIGYVTYMDVYIHSISIYIYVRIQSVIVKKNINKHLNNAIFPSKRIYKILWLQQRVYSATRVSYKITAYMSKNYYLLGLVFVHNKTEV